MDSTGRIIFASRNQRQICELQAIMQKSCDYSEFRVDSTADIIKNLTV